MSSVKEFDPSRRAFMRKGARYAVGTGLLAYGFTEIAIVGRKTGESSRKAIAKVEEQGIKAPDDETLRQANLKREPSKGLVRLDSKQPVTQQERDAVAQQAVSDWSVKNEYNNDPDRPADFRIPASLGEVVVGGWMAGPGAINLIDTIKDKGVNWVGRPALLRWLRR